MALVVLNMPALMPHCDSSHGAVGPALLKALQWEQKLVRSAVEHEITTLLLFNTKGEAAAQGADATPAAAAAGLERAVLAVRTALDPAYQLPYLTIDLNSAGAGATSTAPSGGDVSGVVSAFLQGGVKASRAREPVKSLPEAVLREDAMVFLNIPMDAETPSMRLLRPQALVQASVDMCVSISEMLDMYPHFSQLEFVGIIQ